MFFVKRYTGRMLRFLVRRARYCLFSLCEKRVLFQDPNWFHARRHSDKKEGIIPANYVQKRTAMSLHAMP